MQRSFETGVSQAAIVIAALEHYLASGLTPTEIEGEGEVKEMDATGDSEDEQPTEAGS